MAIWWRKREERETGGPYVFAAYFSERLPTIEHAVNIATKNWHVMYDYSMKF